MKLKNSIIFHFPFSIFNSNAVGTNDSRILTWENFALGRIANSTFDLNLQPQPLSCAQIQLFRSGDYIVRSNNVERLYRFADPFDVPEEEWGQSDADKEYIDSVVGTNLENGYYKLTVTVPSSVGRRTLIMVGDQQLVADQPGEYAFLLEKGEKYPLSFLPYSDDIEVAAVDDIPAISLMSLMPSSPTAIADDNHVGRWSRDGGDFRWMRPNLLVIGWVMWMPTLCISPDVWHPSVVDPDEWFRALLISDGENVELSSAHWYSSNHSLQISDPFSSSTEITWNSENQLSAATASVDVNYLGEVLHSDLSFYREGMDPDMDLSGFAIEDIPDTMFVNDDDDNGNQVVDYQECSPWIDDDLFEGKIVLSSSVSTNGTIQIDNHYGFFGSMYDSSSEPMNYDDEWTVYDEYGREVQFRMNPSARSEGYRTSQLKARWIPEVGPERTCVKRFTVVEPVVEPICNEIKEVVEDGVPHRLTYNPCGVAIGQNAYFKIEVEPNDYPDSMIVWNSEGDGRVEFVGGNTGREICVRGLSEGEVKLRISIGDCPSAKPTFTVQVVELSRVKLSFWIIEGTSWTVERVNELVATANDIYRQVGMEFYVNSITTTNIPNAMNVVLDGPPLINNMSFDQVVDLRSGTGGIECYCIRSFVDKRFVRAATTSSGIILTERAVDITLAHEIGHACGMEDIYAGKGHLSIPIMQRFEFSHAMEDWNYDDPMSSAISSRYYHKRSCLANMVKKELMYGESDSINDTRHDISSGGIYGVWQFGDSEESVDFVHVKTGMFKCSGISRNPISN